MIRKALLRLTLPLFLAASCPHAASAQIAICLLTTDLGGELSLGGDLMSWRTTRPSVVRAVNVLPAILTVQAPTEWSVAPAGAPPTNFAVSAEMSGANLGQLLGGQGLVSGLLSILGTTTATVSLGATAGRPFRAGEYAAQVLVTCAPR